MLGIVCVQVDVHMKVHQCLSMNFRHGTGITHTNPNRGPLSDESYPLLNLLAMALD